jgi:Zn-dependent protease
MQEVAVRAQVRLGRVFGIPIGLHYTWLLLAVLITVSLGGYFGYRHEAWSEGLVWGAAVVTGILFFVSLILHEISHALVARAHGIPVGSITLFALGGVAQIEEDASRPGAEFFMAIVGPLTSAVIGFALIGLAMLGGWVPGAEPRTALVSVTLWLGYINIVLAIFNMIPGYPLDGGRVLRSIVWGITGNVDQATRAAARTGQVVAVLLIAYGLVRFFFRADVGGLWLALIGWFLFSAANASYAQARIAKHLRGIHVRDVMSARCVPVAADLSVQTFVEDYLLRGGHHCFVVNDAARNEPVGIVIPTDLRRIDRAEWPTMPIRRAMRPLAGIETVKPDEPLLGVLALMGRQDTSEVPVMDEGHFAGIVTRSDVVNYVHARTELGS